MAVMLIESTDPKFSFHLKKNPAGGLTIKKMRSGIISGWYPDGDAQKYALWFKELSTDNSFGVDGKNYLDLTQYASTYFAFHSISTMFSSVLKLDATQEPHNHKIKLPLVQLRTERTIAHLNEFIGLNLTVKNLLDNDVERMAIYEIEASADNITFNEFMMKVYLLFYLLHGDLYQSDIVWMEGMIAKVVGIMNELRSEYFLQYWFKKNILIKPGFFATLEKKLGENSLDGKIFHEFGDTQMQRKAFVDKHIDCHAPILDVGCGGGDYLFPYSKKLKKNNNLRIVGVDIDEKIRDTLNLKIADRKMENSMVVESIDQVGSFITGPHDIICVEVIEHMPIEDARKLVCDLLRRDFRKVVISTPNVEFNKFYRTMTGFRHDDHHFELNRQEFQDFMQECIDAVGLDRDSLDIRDYGVGDQVDSISMAQACVITRKITKAS